MLVTHGSLYMHGHLPIDTADDSATKDSSGADVVVTHDGNEAGVAVMVGEDKEVVVVSDCIREKWMQL